MEDGAAAHRAKMTSEAYRRLGVTKIQWPASSPDLNPIENVWRLLKARLRQRKDWPNTLEAMSVAVREEWEALSLEDFYTILRVCLNVYRL